MHLNLPDDSTIFAEYAGVLSVGIWLRNRARTSEDSFTFC